MASWVSHCDPSVIIIGVQPKLTCMMVLKICIMQVICMHCAVIKSQDFHSVCQFLRNLKRNHVIELGLKLGLYYPTLEKMNDVPTEMVAAWLNRQDNVLGQSGEPTWRGLADALEMIGHTGIANDIRKSKCHQSSAADSQQCTSGPSQSRAIGVWV